MDKNMVIPDVEDIQAAAERVAPHAHYTPVFTSRTLDEMSGRRLFFKCENFQRAGAFKFRGACNAVFSLDDVEAASGVATHSSGNHAAALALAARLRGIPAYIVMPRSAPGAKQRAVVAYGGHITFCDDTLESRQETARRVIGETGAVFVHPYDDPRVIAGQGTVGLEFHAQTPELDTLLVPVSGGGLISGVALASRALRKETIVLGIEPEAADDARRSLDAGRPLPRGPARTIADGLRAALCERTFTIIRRHVRAILTVTDEQMVAAMRLIWERLKVVVEPSAAVGLAAMLNHAEGIPGQRIGIVLSGGNVDLDNLPWERT